MSCETKMKQLLAIANFLKLMELVISLINGNYAFSFKVIKIPILLEIDNNRIIEAYGPAIHLNMLKYFVPSHNYSLKKL